MRKPPVRSSLPFPDLRRELEPAFALAHREDKYADVQTRIYFIQESGIGAIKIGVSKHAQVRTREIQDNTPHTLTLLATIEGGRGVEHTLHSLFAHAHIRGEWFHPVAELLAYIAETGESPSETARRDMEALFEKRRSMRVIA
jgi:hypothetical protein